MGSRDRPLELPCIDASLEPSTPIPKFFPEWYINPTEEELVEGVVQLEPTMPFLGALAPKPCGTFVSGPPKNERKILWDPRKPLPGLHPGSWNPNHKEPLLLYSGEKHGPAVKVITPQEVCFLLNGRFGPKDTRESSSTAALSLVAAPRKLALLGLTWFGSEALDPSSREEQYNCEPRAEARFAPGSAGQEKTGLCNLPWEEHTEETLRRWLRLKPEQTQERMKVASRALSKLLRHEAGTTECPISPEGWVRWQDLLAHPLCRDHREDMLEWGVTHNSKDRFVAKQDAEGVWYAAAWSGHTITGVSGPSREVDPAQTPDVLVHGTYRQYVPSIQRQGLRCRGRDLHLQNPKEHAFRWRKDLEVKVVVDVKKAESLGCRFRKTGNLVWLTSQAIPPEAILKFEEWDDLTEEAASSSTAFRTTYENAPGNVTIMQREMEKLRAETKQGLWEPKEEIWVNQENPVQPVELKQDVVDVAKTLAEVASTAPEGSQLKVDPATFEVKVCEEKKEDEESSEEQGEECDWDPSSDDEVTVVQATAAKSTIEEEGVSKMEIEEEVAPIRRRRKIQLGSAQILLLQAVGDADAANWSSLQQCIQSHNTTGAAKSDLLKRMEQLADLRQESRQGAIIALQSERDRAWRVSRAEDLYRSELDEEMARLEKHNPVGPRLAQPLITNARLNADIEAGVGVWRARRDHRARERAARHRRDQPHAPRSGESYLMDVDPQEGGRTLDEAMTARAKEELKTFRKELRGTGQGGTEKRPHQKDSKKRRQLKKMRAKEKKAVAKEGVTEKERKGSEARFAPGTNPAEQTGGVEDMEVTEGHVKREVRFGEGPKATQTSSHTYNPVDLSNYAHWRLDLADSNGLALGDDEAEEAIKQLQMMSAHVDMMPPLYRSPDDGELRLRNGKPARMLRPRDFCLMVLEEGHWISVTALKQEGQRTWDVRITGIARLDQQDVADWKATLQQLTDIHPAALLIREGAAQPRVPGACGFAALSAISLQSQNIWDWDPMEAAAFTADPVLDAKIFNHLQNLKRCLRLHDAPDDYCKFVLQVRGIFLRTSMQQVVLQQVMMGRGVKGTVSRFATGFLLAPPLVIGNTMEEGEEDESLESVWGYMILAAIFLLLSWRAFCLCRKLRGVLHAPPRSPSGGISPSRKVGGSRRKVRFLEKNRTDSGTEGGRGHVSVEFLGGPKNAKNLFPKAKPLRFSNVQGSSEWDQEGWSLLLDRYSKATMSVYRSQYRWWQLFCRRRGIDPVRYVAGYDRQEENLFLEYMVHCSVNEQKAPGTVKIRMAAIRSIHLSMGLPDPTAHLPRIPLAMAGIKRRWGTKVRRKPVTPEMLKWMGKHLEHGKTKEGSLMFAAVCFGYFFLLRASEYLCVGYNQPDKGLRGQDVVLKTSGRECTLQNIKEADEIVLTIRSSKTDIYNRGEIRNHFRSEEEICPVKAAIALFLNYPQRYGEGNDTMGPLFRTEDDKLLPRGAVQAMIERSGRALNMPEGDLGTHSLRFGGASAIWAAYGESALVKRWGRWASDSFQTYLWDARKASQDVAKKMASVDLTPA